MSQYREIAEARRNKDFEYLNRLSLERVYGASRLSRRKSMLIITGWASGLTAPESRQANKNLYQELRTLGGGAVKINSLWSAGSSPVVIREEMLAGYGLTRVEAEKLMRKYDQKTVLFCGPETGGKVAVIFEGGEQSHVFDPDWIATTFGWARGVTLVGFDYPAQTDHELVIDSVVTTGRG